jgi:methylated-DNA-protein-cysteine methyltransferase related protein
MEEERSFGVRACDAVRAIPAGRVASYGAVAAAAGRPGAARAVGRVLRGLSDDAGVPWWRVINARGEITIPRSGLAGPLQRALLADEGVPFDDAGRVDLARHAWHFDRDGGAEGED